MKYTECRLAPWGLSITPREQGLTTNRSISIDAANADFY